MSDQNFDIRIRTVLDGAGLRATEQQIEAITQDVRRLNGEAAQSTFGAVSAGSAVGGFLGGLAEGALREGVAQLQQAAMNAVNLADRLDDLSGKAGVSAEALQVLGNAASLNGGSIEAMANALAFLNRTSAAARSGNEAAAQAFARLGVSLEDLSTMSPDQVMMRIADSASTASDRSRTYADVVLVAGRESGILFSTLEQGSKALDEAGRKMGVFGNVTTKQLAYVKDELDKVNNRMTVYVGNVLAAGIAGAKSLGKSELGELLVIMEALQNPLKAYQAMQTLAAHSVREVKEEMEATEKAAKGTTDNLAPAIVSAKEIEEHMAGLRKAYEEDLQKTGRELNANMIEQVRIHEMIQRAEQQRGRELDDNMQAAALLHRHLEKQKPDAEALAQDAEREAAARERAAVAAERAREALEDVEGNFEGVDARGSEGVRARARAREQFNRELRRRAEAAASAVGPDGKPLNSAADIARLTKEAKDRFDEDMRAARGRFGGSVARPKGADITGGDRFDRWGRPLQQAAQKTSAGASGEAATSGAAAAVDKGAQTASGAARELASAAANYQKSASELSAASAALRAAFYPIQKAIQQLRSDVDSLKPMQGSGN